MAVICIRRYFGINGARVAEMLPHNVPGSVCYHYEKFVDHVSGVRQPEMCIPARAVIMCRPL